MLARVTRTLKRLASSPPRPSPTATPIPGAVREENAFVFPAGLQTRPHPTTNSRGDEQSFSDSFPRGETESQVRQENAWTLTTPVTSQRAPHAWGNVGPGLMLPGGVVVERSADGSAAHSSVRGGPAEDRARAVKP